ncbi:hypothetical protein [Caldilinea sp.]|uniref:hypothetical protein n=1 Tax=Caldilinea sp. TaxID=2293560 RepID=UPI002B968BE5|nr:hypothetical protein [Anaerolineales bacterium]HQY90405.1 hypothetical protein [Caldilinea sp.]HRA66699.1 hypothetical protein [Caldilinea sp.]
MTTETQVLIAFILYLIFFGWVGARRGVWSEAVLLLVTVGFWVLLQERGTIIVRLTNFAGKFFVLVGSGGLSGSAEDALQAVQAAPNVITNDNEAGFLFLVWAVIVLITFIVGSDKRWSKYNKNTGLAIVLGVINGIVFAALLLPVLGRILETTPAVAVEDAPLNALFLLVSGLWDLIYRTFQSLWTWVQPVPPSVWLLIITLLLVLIAWPMRGASSKKK